MVFQPRPVVGVAAGIIALLLSVHVRIHISMQLCPTSRLASSTPSSLVRSVSSAITRIADSSTADCDSRFEAC